MVAISWIMLNLTATARLVVVVLSSKRAFVCTAHSQNDMPIAAVTIRFCLASGTIVSGSDSELEAASVWFASAPWQHDGSDCCESAAWVSLE